MDHGACMLSRSGRGGPAEYEGKGPEPWPQSPDSLGISRTVLDGGVGKMAQMARSNLRNIPRP